MLPDLMSKKSFYSAFQLGKVILKYSNLLPEDPQENLQRGMRKVFSFLLYLYSYESDVTKISRITGFQLLCSFYNSFVKKGVYIQRNIQRVPQKT